MFARATIPLGDDTPSLSLFLSGTNLASGRIFRGTISLDSPLYLDSRPGETIELATLKAGRFYGPPGVTALLLLNDLAPTSGLKADPREDIINSVQVLVMLAPETPSFSDARLTLFGEFAAPESPVIPVSVPLVANAAYLSVRNASGVLLGSIWEEVAFDSSYAYSKMTHSGLLQPTQQVIGVDASTGPVILYLPSAVKNRGKWFSFKRLDASSNIVLLNTTPEPSRNNELSKIDGSNSYNIVTQFKVMSDGDNWIVVA